MIIARSSLVLYLMLSTTACMEAGIPPLHQMVYPDDPDSWGEESIININLRSGVMTGANEIHYNINSVITLEEVDLIVYAQVIAEIDVVYSNIGTDFMRVVFESDRSEWVSAGLESNHYSSEYACLDSGMHCDEVRPGESTSGVFQDRLGNWVGVTNVYCLWTGGDYAYTVTAYVVDVSMPEYSPISKIVELPIYCTHEN